MKPVIRGQDLALEEFNRRGGVAGRKVRLITLDDAYDPKRCLDNVTTLIDKHKVTALYGLASTANVAAVLPLLAERKVPLVGVYTGAPALRAFQPLRTRSAPQMISPAPRMRGNKAGPYFWPWKSGKLAVIAIIAAASRISTSPQIASFARIAAPFGMKSGGVIPPDVA